MKKRKYSKKRILLTGPQIGSASGISTHIQSIKESELKKKYEFILMPVGSGEKKETLKKITIRLVKNYIDFIKVSIIIDLVHINTALTTKALLRDLVFCFLCKLLNKKNIVQFHSGKEIEDVLKNKLENIILKTILNLSDRCVFLLNKEVESLKKINCKDKIRQIYNGIDITPYKGIIKNFENKPFLSLGYIGRITEEKGILESLKVIRSLIHNFDIPVKYYIAGIGPMMPILIDSVRRFNIERNVIFLGLIQNERKIKFWEQIDLFLFLTKFSEGIPYAFLESLASGTPVITTRSGGLDEIVERVPECFIVDPNETDKIANMIKELFSNTDKLKWISSRLKIRAENMFSSVEMLKNIDKCYQEII